MRKSFVPTLPLRIVTDADVPEPPEITDAILRRVAEEARDWREAFAKVKEELELLR